MNRRAFLASSLTAPLALADSRTAPVRLAVFAKHLQFVPVAKLPEVVAEIGFNAIDLPVRPKGVIEPERAAAELPPLVKALRDKDIEVRMITSHIVDAASPHAETVMAVLKDLGIKYYRWDGFRYDYRKPIDTQLESLKPRVAALAKLNQKYGLCAIYHTHSGVGRVGASIWDVYGLLRNHDPAQVAVNYDVGHATIEGGLGGWINSFHLLGPHLGGIALKDFHWKRDAKGTWQAAWTPIGEGMVKFPEFFKMLASRRDFHGPVQLHYEYPLGGADTGKSVLTIPESEVFAAMKRDLTKLRGLMKEAAL